MFVQPTDDGRGDPQEIYRALTSGTKVSKFLGTLCRRAGKNGGYLLYEGEEACAGAERVSSI